MLVDSNYPFWPSKWGDENGVRTAGKLWIDMETWSLPLWLKDACSFPKIGSRIIPATSPGQPCQKIHDGYLGPGSLLRVYQNVLSLVKWITYTPNVCGDGWVCLFVVDDQTE